MSITITAVIAGARCVFALHVTAASTENAQSTG